MIIPIPSSRLVEGLEDKVQKLPPTAGLKRAIEQRMDDLRTGKTTDQYLVFKPVTEAKFDDLDSRNIIGPGTRATYCGDLETLILKVPTTAHESAHGDFSSMLIEQSTLMRVRRELQHHGRATRTGRRSKKQADSSYKPRYLRPKSTDWPTIVLESGISESLRRLRIDAEWWLSNSGGDVKIVLIFSVKVSTKAMRIEHWEMAPAPATRPVTRATPAGTLVPTCVQQVNIDPTGVHGGPITLAFEKIFLRLPNPPVEHDITFTIQDLQIFSSDLWDGCQ
jgi:hypothetical protein